MCIVSVEEEKKLEEEMSKVVRRENNRLSVQRSRERAAFFRKLAMDKVNKNKTKEELLDELPDKLKYVRPPAKTILGLKTSSLE